MSIRSFLRRALAFLVPLSVSLTVYLYLYPVFDGCSFPRPNASSAAAFIHTLSGHLPLTKVQPDAEPIFRLLTLADPQLEGDSSLPDPDDGFMSRIARRWETFVGSPQSILEYFNRGRDELRGCIVEDVPHAMNAFRKQADLFGNDYYLAHIYRTLHWWTRPTHVTVLGDLIGSQWVTDEEFEWRGWRYWNRVFRYSHKVLPDEDSQTLNPTTWSSRLINIAGNHDIGYAGDISPARMSRFECIFGPPDWDIRFQYPSRLLPQNHTTVPTLHLVNLNTLNLDTPSLHPDLQSTSYSYLNSVISERSHAVGDNNSFTLLLTHLPLHKPASVCVDAPHFAFFEEDDFDNRFKKGGLREQNHLSEHVSHQGILQGLFGMSPDETASAGGRGRRGLILTGHDHEGCDVWHHVGTIPNSTETRDENNDDVTAFAERTKGWLSIPYRHRNISEVATGIREVTLRSMMGEFGGNAGLLSAWFDFDNGTWEFEISMCPLGTQHMWWFVHVLDIIALVGGILWIMLELLQAWNTQPKIIRNERGRDKPAIEARTQKSEDG